MTHAIEGILMKLKRYKFTRWDIFWIIIILMGSTYLLFMHFYNNVTYSKAQIDKMFAPITSKYGIKIVYRINDHFFSDLANPGIPAGPDPLSKVTPIRHRVLARYPDILQKAFAKYPVEIIRKYLKGIYFAGEIDQAGFKYGGSYDPFRRIIFLVDNGTQTNNEDISTFHHEFSSLLIRSHSFFINPWTDQNPKGFKYLEDVYDTWNAMQKEIDISRDGNKQDYEKGFMDTYGETDFENDFNEYAAMIFTYPKKFKKIMNQYPRVRAKFLIWLDFYHNKVDPIFTEDYLLGKH
jgi:hypothetical protein